MRPARTLARLLSAVAALAAGGLVALLIAGCGGGASASASRTASTASTATATTATTTSTSGTSTTFLPGIGRPVVTVGDKNTPEQFILGELYDLALTAEGFRVSLTRNIGPPSVSFQAVQQGSLDVYPEYLNVWDSQVAGITKRFSSMKAAYAAGSAFAFDHALQTLQPTPGSDTQGIAVLSSFAAANGLRSLADLAAIAPTMTLGAPIQFSQDPAGLPALEHAYGFQPATVAPVDIGAQYAALTGGQVQAAWVYTTDGQLAEPEFTQLRDPRHVLGFGNVIPVVSDHAVETEGPTFVATIDEVDALLTTKVLRELNAQAHFDGLDPTTIARQFLEAHGLLPPQSGAA